MKTNSGWPKQITLLLRVMNKHMNKIPSTKKVIFLKGDKTLQLKGIVSDNCTITLKG